MTRLMHQPRKRQKGFSLIAVLALGTAATLAVSGLIGFANSNLTLGRRAVASEQAFLAAEAGVEHFKRMLRTGESLGEAQSFDLLNAQGEKVGEYELVPSAAFGLASIVSRGSSGEAVRSIQAEFVQAQGAIFSYSIQAGEEGLTLGNGAEIAGDAYSNGDITGGNGSSIEGDAFASGDIVNVETGSAHPGSSPQAFPVTEEEIGAWKEEALASVSGGLELSGESNFLGPRKLEGNLVLENGAMLTLTGTLWVTGDIVMGNGSSIYLSSGYGSRGGAIIADGEIDIGNSTFIGGSGSEESAVLFITTSSSLSAITLGNNAGGVMLYAPNGTIAVGNNAGVKAIAGKAITLGNNVVLEPEADTASIIFASGPNSGWILSDWREVPNN